MITTVTCPCAFRLFLMRPLCLYSNRIALSRENAEDEEGLRVPFPSRLVTAEVIANFEGAAAFGGGCG